MKKSFNNKILIIMVLILVFCFLLFLYHKKSLNNNNEFSAEYVLLEDYSTFFTINSCAYKYISYLSTNNKKQILNILDKDYINQNNINENNLFNYLNKLDGNYGFNTKKVYYEKNKGSIKKYYVYGNLIDDIMSGSDSSTDYYLIINLDFNNNLFSVIPYDGSLFNEVE